MAVPDKDGEAIRFIGNLQRLEMKPGDKFVITCHGKLSIEQAERIRDAWDKFVGGDTGQFMLLVLDGGLKLGAIGKAD